MSADARSDEQAATAAYIASLTSALADVARRQGLRDLTYLLDMARLEAEGRARAVRPAADAEPPQAQSFPDMPDEPSRDEPDKAS
jgi:hypothetical protein